MDKVDVEPVGKDPTRPPVTLVSLMSEASRVEAMIVALAEANGGEIDHSLDQYLDEIEGLIETKADQYQYVMERIEAMSEHFKKRAEAFQRAKRTTDWALERIKGRIKDAMQALGVQEVRGVDYRFKLSKAKSKLVLADDFVTRCGNEDLITVKTTYEPKNEAIRALLELGHTVEGAKLEPSFSLRPYINRKELK